MAELGGGGATSRGDRATHSARDWQRASEYLSYLPWSKCGIQMYCGRLCTTMVQVRRVGVCSK